MPLCKSKQFFREIIHFFFKRESEVINGVTWMEQLGNSEIHRTNHKTPLSLYESVHPSTMFLCSSALIHRFDRSSLSLSLPYLPYLIICYYYLQNLKRKLFHFLRFSLRQCITGSAMKEGKSQESFHREGKAFTV